MELRTLASLHFASLHFTSAPEVEGFNQTLGSFMMKRYSIEDAKWCCGDLETTPWRAVISYLITLRLHVCIEKGGEAALMAAYSLGTSIWVFVLKCCALIKLPF